MKVTDVAVLLGKRIKELRELRGLSQAELASKSLKSVETISNFERAKTTPSVETLAVLSRVLDTPLSEFFTFERSGAEQGSQADTIAKRLRLLASEEHELLSLFIDSLLKGRAQ